MNEYYFNIYQDCFIVKGAKNSIIYDTFEQKYITIPESILLDCNKYSYEVTSENKYFFNFLAKEEYGEYSNISNDKRKEIIWNPSKKIIELIIEIDHDSDIIQYEKVINHNNVDYLQVRVLDSCNNKFLINLIKIIDKSTIRSLEVLLPYDYSDNEEIITIISNCSRLQILYFYNSPFNQVVIDNDRSFNNIYYVSDLTNHKYCGVISPDYFSANLLLYSKNSLKNSCLSNKAFICKSGDIKNCPSTTKILGNIRDGFDLSRFFNNKYVEKIWNINKDLIKTCKDCEFRYICNDCRAFTEDPDDIYSKPLKCGYNPYIGEWEEWNSNSLKQKAIKYYELENII